MDKDLLFNEIQKHQFFLLDLNLYLDNFPDNEKATKDFKQYSTNLKKLMWEYEKNYGPLINFGFAYFQNPEEWVNSPWPWENRSGGKM